MKSLEQAEKIEKITNDIKDDLLKTGTIQQGMYAQNEQFAYATCAALQAKELELLLAELKFKEQHGIPINDDIDYNNLDKYKEK